MRDREHGGEEDRFERWEMRGREHGEKDVFERWEIESRERGRLRKWECWFKFMVRRNYAIYTCFFFSRASLVEPVWFGSISFRLWKPNRTINILWFFNRFNWFFFTVRFFWLFCFPVFSVFWFFCSLVLIILWYFKSPSFIRQSSWEPIASYLFLGNLITKINKFLYLILRIKKENKNENDIKQHEHLPITNPIMIRDLPNMSTLMQ
jgi:hypothetical protein